MHKVRVNLPNYGYDIYIENNALRRLKAVKKEFGLSKRSLVIADKNVAALYGDSVMEILNEAGLNPKLVIIKAGESSKCMQTAESLYTTAIETGLDRKSAVFALGGGVVGDLAGFVAATYMRGVPFFQIPTSLLAQVDSSVGGKVAINHALGKNLIGAFYQPKEVIIDLELLGTLPKREISTGLGEIIKYGIIADEKFFAYLEENAEGALNLSEEAAVHMISRSCEIKADVVTRDEKESSLRMILNFGHTIAHAIESETHYAAYNHGEAVAIGMHGAALISQKMGLITESEVKRIKSLIEKLGLPLYAEKCTAENMYNILFHDKKVVDGKIKWVLIDKIGHTVIRDDVPMEIVKNVLEMIQK